MAQSISPPVPLTRTPLLVRLLRGPSAFANSTRVWLVLMAFLGVVNLLITFVGAGLEQDPRVGFFAWPVLLGFGLVGLIGIWLSHQTGFPAAWDTRVSNRQRLLDPSLIGLGIGLWLAATDAVVHWTRFFTQQMGLAAYNAPFPGSLLLYPSGAILVEVLYRLLPIPLLLWLISNVLLRGRGQGQMFWVLAVLTSLIEPVQQDLMYLQASGVLLAASQFAPDFVLNLTQAAMFRRSGYLASILVRVATYLVWHVVYGNFICRC